MNILKSSKINNTMGNLAKRLSYGYVCPVRGCDKKKNRRFTLGGLFMHMRKCHGESEVAKRLRAKKDSK